MIESMGHNIANTILTFQGFKSSIKNENDIHNPKTYNTIVDINQNILFSLIKFHYNHYNHKKYHEYYYNRPKYCK
jgi:hypothetical protein